MRTRVPHWLRLVGSAGAGALLLGLAALVFISLLGGNGDEEIATLPADTKMFSASRTWEAGVTDDGLEALAGRCPYLEVLVVNGSSHISDRGLSAISKMKKLKALFLQRARGEISSDGLRYLAQLKELEELDLSGRNLTVDELKSLGYLQGLKRLRISGKGLGESDFNDLRQTLPNCIVELR